MNKKSPQNFHLAPVEPLAVDSDGAAKLLGMTKSTFYKMVNSGRIGPVGISFGRCTRYVISELRQWAKCGMPRREVWVEMIKEQKTPTNYPVNNHIKLSS